MPWVQLAPARARLAVPTAAQRCAHSIPSDAPLAARRFARRARRFISASTRCLCRLIAAQTGVAKAPNHQPVCQPSHHGNCFVHRADRSGLWQTLGTDILIQAADPMEAAKFYVKDWL
jgi:hypothetical protein